MRSLGFKLGILYIFLSIINISFFTILIHENQVDLITKVKKYESIELATDIITEIKLIINDINNNLQEFSNNDIIENNIVEKCKVILPGISYIIFNIKGRVIHESYPDAFPYKKSYLWEAQNAITRKDFSNKPYTASFANDKEIHFYVPLNIISLETAILLFRFDISDIQDKLSTIYRLVFIFVIFIVLFHILFGVILHRIVLYPINILAKNSNDISKGNYKTRVKLKRMDEFGILTNAFNHMAASIQEKIQNLNNINKRMEIELQMAGEVQKSIYPFLRKTKYFNIAIHHRPLISVSGDYHDIFPIGDEKYGCIVADVSGHGVAAALITMLIKDRCEEIASNYLDTKEFLKHINTIFGDLIQKYEKYFTAFYIIIDGKNKTITFSNAGQPYAFLLRGKKMWKLDTEGAFIGFEKELNSYYKSKKIKLASLDKIIIYTDGICEATNSNNEQYSIKRLQRAVLKNNSLSCNKLLESVISDLSTFTHKATRKDDETLIIIEMKQLEKNSLA